MSIVSFPEVNSPLIPQAPVVSIAPKRTTIIAQMLSGTATAGVLTQNVGINKEDGLFGEDSMAADLVRSFRRINETSRLDVIALADVAGTDASGIIAFSGTATKAGTITVWIGDKRKEVTIDVAVSATATAVGALLVTAIGALGKSLVTSINTTGSVALTAKNSGTVGNGIGIMVDLGETAGITIALTAMASGATDPSMTGLAALITERSDIVMPFDYGISTFKDLLDGRFNSNNKIEDGRLITSISDTESNASVVGNAENSQSLVIFSDALVSTSLKKGTSIFAMPYQKSAEFAGVRGLRLEPGTNISSFVTTRVPLDQKGGVHTNSLPYANTGLLLSVVPEGEGYTDLEVIALRAAGISVMGNNLASNKVICGQVVTTYKTNTAGQVDLTYKFLNSVDTSTAAREFIFNSIKVDYAQKRLTLGSATPGTVSIGEVKADFSKYYLTLTTQEFSLLQGGIIEAGINEGKTILSIFKENLKVSFNINTGEITAESILPIVGQVRSIFAPLSIVFDVNAL